MIAAKSVEKGNRGDVEASGEPVGIPWGIPQFKNWLDIFLCRQKILTIEYFKPKLQKQIFVNKKLNNRIFQTKSKFKI